MKRMLKSGALALGGFLVVHAVAALAAAALRGNGFPPETAGTHGVVVALCVTVPLLMLAGVACFRVRAAFAAILSGCTAGMLATTWLHGAEVSGSLRVAGLGIALAFLMREVMRLVCALRLGEDAARGVGGLLVAASVGSHFWSGPLAQGDTGSLLATWGSVPAMTSFAHGTFRMAYLPEVYRTWLGPVVPYPGSIWTVYAVYGGMGLVAGCLAWWIGMPKEAPRAESSPDAPAASITSPVTDTSSAPASSLSPSR